MKLMPPNQPWSGIFPPMVTPLKDRDQLDYAGLERLIEHMLAGGVHGIFILGTTGEAPSLSYRLRRALVETTCKLVRGRVPILVGITDTAFVEAVKLAQFAAESGAAAGVLAAPYYFPNSQAELMEYLRHLIPELPFPVFLYNMPSHTKTTFEIDVLREAMQVPEIIGIKDSSGHMLYFHQLVRLRRERPDWSLLMGPEELLAESLFFGGNGGIAGGANLFPRLFVNLFEACQAAKLDEVRRLQTRILEISSNLYRIGKYSSSIIKGLKCALHQKGICDDFMAEPFHRFRQEERQMVQDCLRKLESSDSF